MHRNEELTHSHDDLFKESLFNNCFSLNHTLCAPSEQWAHSGSFLIVTYGRDEGMTLCGGGAGEIHKLSAGVGQGGNLEGSKRREKHFFS